MKNLFFLSLTSFLFCSCVSSYMQVCKVSQMPDSESKVKVTNDGLVYEDLNCKVTYDMWSDGGKMDFVFTNKSSNDIYIIIDKCFFIMNGFANDYYSDVVITHRTSSSSAANSSTAQPAVVWNFFGSTTPSLGVVYAGSNNSTTVGNEETIRPSKVVCVPAKSSKSFNSFTIDKSVFKECDDNKFNYPNKVSREVTFTPENSPVVFENRICYSLTEDLANIKQINTSFYLSNVVNYKNAYNITYKNAYSDCGVISENPRDFKGSYYKTITVPLVGGGADQYYKKYHY